MARKLLWLPTDFEMHPETLEDGITQSEMQTMDNCPEKWNNRYNLRLTRKDEFSWASAYGKAVHAALEEWYSTKCRRYTWDLPLPPKGTILDLQRRQEYEYWDHLGQVQMQVYTSYYKRDPKVFKVLQDGIEQIVRVTYDLDDDTSFELTGMIDLLLHHFGQAGIFTMDHKTTGRLDRAVTLGWTFRFQFMFYCWLAHRAFPKLKIKGWIPNGIKKSQLQWKPEKEGIEEHMARIRTDMLEFPEKYFYREPLIFRKDNIRHFEETQLKPKLYLYKLLKDPKTPMETKIAIGRRTNTDICTKYGTGHQCPYLPLCEHGPSVEGFRYRRRDVKHTELEEALEE